MTDTAFQANAFQTDAFQIIVPEPQYWSVDLLPPTRRNRETPRQFLSVFENRSIPSLLPHDRVYGADGQVPTQAFPNPERQAPVTALRALATRTLTDVAQSDTFYIGFDREYAGPGQVQAEDVPLHLPQPRHTLLRLQRDVAVRALTDVAMSDTFYIGFDTMYGAPGQVPSRDMQVALPPRAYPRLIELRSYYDNLLPWTLVSHDQIYGGDGQVPSYDHRFALPPRPYTRAADLRLYFDSLLPWTLTGQDAIYGGPGQVPNMSMMAMALPPPIYPRMLDLRTYLDGAGTIYYPPTSAQPPLPAYDYPLPIRPRTGPGSVYGMPTPLLVSALSQYLPVLSSDVLDVLGRRANRRYLGDGGVDVYPTLLLGHDQVYGDDGLVPSYDWQMSLPSKGYRRPPLDWIHPTDVILIGSDRLFGAPGQVPAQDFPPPPTGYRRSLDLRLYTESLYPLPGTGHDTMYGADGQVPTADFPLPLRYQRATDLRLHVSSLLIPSTVQVPSWDFPVPRPYPRALDLRLSSDYSLPLLLAGSDRVYAGPGQVVGLDLPLRLAPQGYRRAPDLSIFTLATRPPDMPVFVPDISLPVLGYRRVRQDWSVYRNFALDIVPVGLSYLSPTELPSRGYPRSKPAVYNLGRGPRPFTILILQPNLTLEAWLYDPSSGLITPALLPTPDLESTAQLWVPDSILRSLSLSPDAVFGVESEQPDGPDITDASIDDTGGV